MTSVLSGIFGRIRDPYNCSKTYREMRQRIFDLPSSGWDLGDGLTLAVLMESGLEDSCSSLVAVSDGSTSLYLSGGGGFIGVGQRPGGRKRGMAFLEFSHRFEDMLEATKKNPLPAPGMTRFYLVKREGTLLTTQCLTDDLGYHKSALSPLFHKGHELITFIRVIDQYRDEPPLITAMAVHDTDLVRNMLEKGIDPNTADSKGLSALALAASSQQEDLVDLLVEFGADLNARVSDEKKNITNSPVILFPAANGSLPILERLIRAGADLEATDKTGLTPLMSAAHQGHVESVKLLIESGSLLEQKDNCGYTALMFAANAGQCDCARVLLEKGADVNASDNDESRPVMFAAQHGFNDVVKLLLDAGADPLVVGTHGLSAIGFARQNGHKETERLLLEHANKKC